MKYKIGDQVVLLHHHTEYGRYGISDGWGETFTVMRAFAGGCLLITGLGHMYSVYEEMVEPIGGPW